MKPLVVTNSLSKICCKVPQEKTWKVEHTTERSGPIPNRRNSSLRYTGKKLRAKRICRATGGFYMKEKGAVKLNSSGFKIVIGPGGQKSEVEPFRHTQNIFSRFKCRASKELKL